MHLVFVNPNYPTHDLPAAVPQAKRPVEPVWAARFHISKQIWPFYFRAEDLFVLTCSTPPPFFNHSRMLVDMAPMKSDECFD